MVCFGKGHMDLGMLESHVFFMHMIMMWSTSFFGCMAHYRVSWFVLYIYIRPLPESNSCNSIAYTVDLMILLKPVVILPWIVRVSWSIKNQYNCISFIGYYSIIFSLGHVLTSSDQSPDGTPLMKKAKIDGKFLWDLHLVKQWCAVWMSIHAAQYCMTKIYWKMSFMQF